MTQLSVSQVASLTTLRDAARVDENWTPVYNYIRSVITDNGAPKAGVDKSVWQWFEGAVKVNSSDGSFFSDFIRDYSEQQQIIRYGIPNPSGTVTIDKASDNIADAVSDDIIQNDRFLPDLFAIGQSDAGRIASGLFFSNYSPWAGTILFPFLGDGALPEQVNGTQDSFFTKWLLDAGVTSNKLVSGTYDLVSVAEAFGNLEINAPALFNALYNNELSDVIDGNSIGRAATEALLASLRTSANNFFGDAYGLTASERAEGRFQIGGDLPIYASVQIAGGDLFVHPNYILGLLGNDVALQTVNATLLVEDGDDIVNAGTGDDNILGSSGDDLIDGGDGTDFISYSSLTSGINLALGASTGTLYQSRMSVEKGSGYKDYLYGIEGVTLTASNDTVTINGGFGAGKVLALIDSGGTDTIRLNIATGDVPTLGYFSNLGGQYGARYSDGSTVLFNTSEIENVRFVSEAISSSATLGGVYGDSDPNYINFGFNGLTTQSGVDGYAMFGNGGDDHITGWSTGDFIATESGRVIMTGNSGNDVLKFTSGTASINGAVMNGGVGSDTYVLSGLANYYLLNEDGTTSEADRVIFNDSITADEVSLVRGKEAYFYYGHNVSSVPFGSGLRYYSTPFLTNATSTNNDLVLLVHDQETDTEYKIVMKDQFNTSFPLRIFEEIQFSDGSTLNLTGSVIQTYGTELGETLTGITKGASLNDIITAAGGNDTIYGGLGADRLDGGSDNDTIFGDEGNDTLIGGNGDDQLHAIYGNDIIIGGSGNDALYVGASVAPAGFVEPMAVTYSRTGTSLNLFLSDGRHIVVENQFLAGGVSSDRLETLYGIAGQTIDLTAMPTPNAGPIAQTDTFMFIQGQSMIGNLLSDNGAGADFDLDGDVLATTLVSTGFGSAIVSSNGDFVYTPLANFTGADGFVYSISDGFGGTTDGIVNINVIANQPPVARDDFFSAFTAQTVAGNLLTDNRGGADSDPESGAMSVLAGTFTTSSGGSVTISANGDFTYASASGFTGRDTFAYTLQDNYGATSTATASMQVANNSINILTGTAGNDIFDGYGSNDTIDGKEGDDLLLGGDGSDTLIGGDGSDVLDGGNSTDTASYVTATAGVDVSLFLPTFQFTVGAGTDTLISIENLTGSNFGDTLLGNSENNRIYGNDGDDVLRGYAGVDTFRGGYGIDTVYGGDDADTILGEWGDDVLYGDAGNDNIKGGNDNDTLMGGDGVDTIRGENGNDNIYGGNTDLLEDVTDPVLNQQLYGGAGNDIIYGGIGYDFIRGDSGKDEIYVGIGDSSKNYVSGGSGDDKIYGDVGDDTIYGGDGDDLIRGGSGVDYIYGEEGQDEIYGEGGNDTMRGGIDANILYGGDGNDTIYGGSIGSLGDNSANDVLYGEDGDDSLYAGTGNDLLDGGVGNDILRGLEGDDTYLISTGAGSDSIYDFSGTLDTLMVTGTIDANDLVFTTGSRDGTDTNDIVIAWTGGADSVEIENQILSSNPNSGIDRVLFADGYTLSLFRYPTWTFGASAGAATNGSSADNTILAYGGDDTVSGLDGNDEIHGGDGVDTVHGGNGNDLLHGGRGDDTVNGDSGSDTIYGGSGVNQLNGGADDDTYVVTTGFDTITDISGNDTLKFVPDVSLEAMSFSNTGTSDVTITVAAGPTAIVINQRSAITTDRIDQITFADGFWLNFADYNSWRFASSGGGNLYGDNNNASGVSIADTLIGGLGADSLRGYDLNDTIFGGAGTDTIFGGNDNDILHGGSDNDTLKGDAGLDILYGGEGNDVLFGGTNYGDTTGDADTLFGGAGDDTLNAGVGDDLLYGEDGDDTLRGQDGVDSIYGGAGVDEIDGGNGNDVIFGDNGDDDISGGADNDLIYGGFGSDAIVGNDGNDVLHGESGDDTLNGLEGIDTVHGGSGNDTIYGGTEVDTLHGDDGDDVIKGQGGNDTVHGGAGADSLQGDEGLDTLYGGSDGDIFLFFAASAFDGNVDLIKDFVLEDGEGATEDVLNLADLLLGYSSTTSAITNFLMMTTDGADTLVSVDRDGTGSAYGFAQIARLEAVTGLEDELALVTNGNLIAA